MPVSRTCARRHKHAVGDVPDVHPLVSDVDDVAHTGAALQALLASHGSRGLQRKVNIA